VLKKALEVSKNLYALVYCNSSALEVYKPSSIQGQYSPHLTTFHLLV